MSRVDEIRGTAKMMSDAMGKAAMSKAQIATGNGARAFARDLVDAIRADSSQRCLLLAAVTSVVASGEDELLWFLNEIESSIREGGK